MKRATVTKVPLSESEWARVFAARCNSKSGRGLSEDERALCFTALQSDRKRYVAMDAAVFNATVPVGSSVLYGDTLKKP